MELTLAQWACVAGFIVFFYKLAVLLHPLGLRRDAVLGSR
jgi:hypothetical protein